MATLAERILELLEAVPGSSDREITDQLFGVSAPQQSINQVCRRLASQGMIVRKERHDGRLGNYPAKGSPDKVQVIVSKSKFLENRPSNGSPLDEDSIKTVLESFLSNKGWQATIAWGKSPGIDIDAVKGRDRWVIEVKGPGSRDAMRVNYFLAILGETLQRMNDDNAKYSIALPDLQQYRNLWDKLPTLTKLRTGITALFVDERGHVVEVGNQ